MIVTYYLREYWRLTTGCVLILILVTYGFITIGCGIKVTDNITLYGNCKEIKLFQGMIDPFSSSADQLYLKPGDDVDPRFTQINTSNLCPTTTSITQSTTTTTMACPPTRDCPLPPQCVCEICTRCPEYKLGEDIITEALNAHATHGVSSYQSGWGDCRDYYLELFQVPGRPKFKSRPSMGYTPTWYDANKPDEDKVYCFRDLGNYFILNRTPDQQGRKRWSWNDADCKGSVQTIHHL